MLAGAATAGDEQFLTALTTQDIRQACVLLLFLVSLSFVRTGTVPSLLVSFSFVRTGTVSSLPKHLL